MSDGTTLESVILRDRRISYATTDRDLRVLATFGDGVFPGRQNGQAVGHSLLDLAPELVGSEDVLAGLLCGELARFQIPRLESDLSSDAYSPCYYSIVELPHRNAAGAIDGLVHVVEEVSDAVQLEQRVMQHRNELRLLQDALREQNIQLLAANAELRRLDEVKSAFVSVAAHELRTPLSSIAGYLEMLLDGDAGLLNAQQREYLRIVDQSASRLLRITRDLLDVTRLEAGRLEITLRPTDLARVVCDTVAEQEPQLELKSQSLVLLAPPGLPFALCDGHRAAQIVGNLLSNASKYSPPHSQITVAVNSLPGDPAFLQVSVTDPGPGIDPADRERLFQPFFRARSASETGTPGAGLGLYIAHALTELHGGELTFDSVPGQGSTFRVTFPSVHSAHLEAPQHLVTA